jgi:hypothetical protein
MPPSTYAARTSGGSQDLCCDISDRRASLICMRHEMRRFHPAHLELREGGSSSGVLASDGADCRLPAACCLLFAVDVHRRRLSEHHRLWRGISLYRLSLVSSTFDALAVVALCLFSACCVSCIPLCARVRDTVMPTQTEG